MSMAAVLIIIGLLVFSLNVFCICNTWEKITRMELGYLPGQKAKIIKDMISEMESQKVNGHVYSGSVDEGLDIAIAIVETYGKDLNDTQ